MWTVTTHEHLELTRNMTNCMRKEPARKHVIHEISQEHFNILKLWNLWNLHKIIPCYALTAKKQKHNYKRISSYCVLIFKKWRRITACIKNADLKNKRDRNIVLTVLLFLWFCRYGILVSWPKQSTEDEEDDQQKHTSSTI
jgi:hypothetical protein